MDDEDLTKSFTLLKTLYSLLQQYGGELHQCANKSYWTKKKQELYLFLTSNNIHSKIHETNRHYDYSLDFLDTLGDALEFIHFPFHLMDHYTLLSFTKGKDIPASAFWVFDKDDTDPNNSLLIELLKDIRCCGSSRLKLAIVPLHTYIHHLVRLLYTMYELTTTKSQTKQTLALTPDELQERWLYYTAKKQPDCVSEAQFNFIAQTLRDHYHINNHTPKKDNDVQSLKFMDEWNKVSAFYKKRIKETINKLEKATGGCDDFSPAPPDIKESNRSFWFMSLLNEYRNAYSSAHPLPIENRVPNLNYYTMINAAIEELDKLAKNHNALVNEKDGKYKDLPKLRPVTADDMK